MANTQRLTRGGRDKALRTTELVTSGALSLNTETSGLTVSGTKAFTLTAPIRAGQSKLVYTDSAASTPVATLAVSSCKGAGATAATRTFSGFGTISASAPKSLELYSPTGEYWIVLSMVGVTVA